MSQQFLGEIRMFGGNFPPRNWAFCNGQLLPISTYDALFALIGTAYGGDGRQSFALPDLRGRLPISMGTGRGLTPRALGEKSGSETVSLTLNQLPPHGHAAMATAADGNITGPAPDALPAKPASTGAFLYAIPGDNPLVPVAMSPAAIGSAGGSQPHDNMMPSLCLSFIIATAGIFPSRN